MKIHLPTSRPLLRRVQEKAMPHRNRDEVLAYAEGVYKLMRARKHLENRGAEEACIRLLESVIKKTEREFFNRTPSKPCSLPITDNSDHSGARLKVPRRLSRLSKRRIL